MAKGDGDKCEESSSEIKKLQKKQPVDSKGLPIHTYNVPGLSRKAGTPGWVKGPASAAARKAK